MLAGEFSSRWIWYKIPYMCIIARASTNRMILFAFRFDCSRRLRYDIGKHQVYRNQSALDLTPIELQLVQNLLMGWPYTLSRDKLYYEVWDKDASFVDENTLRVNISRLRDKLGTFKGDTYIETVRGIGYRWAIHVQK